MTANLNIFEKLNSESEGDDFIEVSATNNPTEFSSTYNAEPKSGKNIFEELDSKNNNEEEKKYSFLETARDVGEQIGSKAISGFGGAYGNIAETLKLQTKEQLPGQEARISRQSDVLDKLNKGIAPTFAELQTLSEEGELPDYSNLPTSNQIKEGIEATTGIGKGKTPAGRIAGRASELVSEGAAFPGGGVKSLATLAGSGLAGQGLREAGANRAVFAGVAPFADYTTEAAEWETYRRLWLGQSR